MNHTRRSKAHASRCRARRRGARRRIPHVIPARCCAGEYFGSSRTCLPTRPPRHQCSKNSEQRSERSPVRDDARVRAALPPLHRPASQRWPTLRRLRHPHAPAAEDLEIPGEPYSFGVLEMAQGAGDFQSLDRAGRRAVHLHFANERRHAAGQGTRALLNSLLHTSFRDISAFSALYTSYTTRSPGANSKLQSLLGRANGALERGRGAEAAQLLLPLLA
jgi:hypothetical protein